MHALRVVGKMILASGDVGQVDGIGEVSITQDRLVAYAMEGVWNDQPFSESGTRFAVAASANLDGLSAVAVPMKRGTFGGATGTGVIFEFVDDVAIALLQVAQVVNGQPQFLKDTRPLAEEIVSLVAGHRGIAVPGWALSGDRYRADLVTRPFPGPAMTAAQSGGAALPPPVSASPVLPIAPGAETGQRAAPAAANPARWLPDPSAQHQFRYWDGDRWTEHVSDNGVVGTHFA